MKKKIEFVLDKPRRNQIRKMEQKAANMELLEENNRTSSKWHQRRRRYYQSQRFLTGQEKKIKDTFQVSDYFVHQAQYLLYQLSLSQFDSVLINYRCRF